MTINYGTGTTVTNKFEPTLNVSNPNMTALLFAQRKLGINNQLIIPVSGKTIPPLYEPFYLGAYSNGITAAQALANMGLQYTLGYQINAEIEAPDLVTIDNISGLTTLTWNSATVGLQALTPTNPSGTVTQYTGSGQAVGTIRNIQIVGNQSILSISPITGSAAFVDTQPITISIILNFNAPDPYISDSACVGAWAFFNQYVTSVIGLTSPDLWISLSVAGRDTSISPTNSLINLVAPQNVALQPDGSYDLTYDIAAYNLGLLNANALGSTTVTQNLSLPIDNTKCVYFVEPSTTFLNSFYIRGSGDNLGLDYSFDGVDWSHTNLSTGTFNKIITNGQIIIAASSVGLFYSTNGITWTNTLTPIVQNYTDIEYFNNYFLATADSITTGGIFYSPNGITWIQAFTDPANIDCIAIAGGIISIISPFATIAITATGDAYFSDNYFLGFNALGIGTTGFTSVGIINEICFLSSTDGVLLYSTDGQTFLPTNLNLGANNYCSVVYVSALNLYLVGSVGNIYTSLNGIQWGSSNFSSISTTINSFIINGNFVFALTSNGIYRSIDGQNWTIGRGSGAFGNYISGAYSNNLYIIGGDAIASGNGLIISYDGISWISTTNSTGIYNGYTLSSTKCTINVVNTNGVFGIAPVLIMLDITKNGFAYLTNIPISTYILGFDCPNLSTLTTTYNDFYIGIAGIATPYSSEQQKYNIQAYLGYVPTANNTLPLTSYIMPDSNTYKMTLRLDIPTYYQYPATGIMQACMSAFMDLNNSNPYNACSGTGIIINQTASDNTDSYPNYNMANQLVFQGVTLFMPSVTGQLYPYRNVCCLQTINGVTDTEYRYEEYQQKVRWLDQNAEEIAESTCINSDGTRKNNSPQVQSDLINNLTALLTNGYNLTILGNTDNTVTVILNPQDVTRWLITITTTAQAGNSGSDITAIFKSYTI